MRYYLLGAHDLKWRLCQQVSRDVLSFGSGTSTEAAGFSARDEQLVSLVVEQVASSTLRSLVLSTKVSRMAH